MAFRPRYAWIIMAEHELEAPGKVRAIFRYFRTYADADCAICDLGWEGLWYEEAVYSWGFILKFRCVLQMLGICVPADLCVQSHRQSGFACPSKSCRTLSI